MALHKTPTLMVDKAFGDRILPVDGAVANECIADLGVRILNPFELR